MHSQKRQIVAVPWCEDFFGDVGPNSVKAHAAEEPTSIENKELERVQNSGGTRLYAICLELGP